MAFEPTIIGRIRQCPRCELRFGNEWELQDHMARDHDLDHINHVYMADQHIPLSY